MRNMKKVLAILCTISMLFGNVIPVVTPVYAEDEPIQPVETVQTESPNPDEPTPEAVVTPDPTPTLEATATPTEAPTEAPTATPTEAPTEAPTPAPTEEPTKAPTAAPTEEPTKAPTATPVEEPTKAPTEAPAETKSVAPATEEETKTPAPAAEETQPAESEHAPADSEPTPAASEQEQTEVQTTKIVNLEGNTYTANLSDADTEAVLRLNVTETRTVGITAESERLIQMKISEEDGDTLKTLSSDKDHKAIGTRLELKPGSYLITLSFKNAGGGKITTRILTSEEYDAWKEAQKKEEPAPVIDEGEENTEPGQDDNMLPGEDDENKDNNTASDVNDANLSGNNDDNDQEPNKDVPSSEDDENKDEEGKDDSVDGQQPGAEQPSDESKSENKDENEDKTEDKTDESLTSDDDTKDQAGNNDEKIDENADDNTDKDTDGNENEDGDLNPDDQPTETTVATETTGTGDENESNDEAAAVEQAAAVEAETVPAEEAEQTGDEETAETPAAEAPATRRIYHYDDSHIHAVVSLSEASAVPDDAELVVTPIRSGNGYDTYMNALNNDGEGYDAGNTLLYDFAFLVDEKDENGNPTGRKIEVQPTEGSMGVAVTFKGNQISSIAPEEATGSDVEVKHLPLNEEARGTADKTLDASFSTGDVKVESVPANVNLDGNTDSVSFSVNGFSTFAFHITISAEVTIDENNSTGILEKEDGLGNKVILDLSNAGLPEGHYDVSLSWTTATPEQRALLEAELSEDVSAEMGEGIRKVAHLPENIQLIDIKILNTETGAEIEPNDKVRVTILQDGKPLPSVIHIIDDQHTEELPVQENSFETGSFSLFLIPGSYTVDFTYEGYTVQLPGRNSYAITDILSKVGIEAPQGVDNTKTTLVLKEGEKVEGDLALVENKTEIKSEVAFTSTYELTVHVIGKDIPYVIRVTDEIGSKITIEFKGDFPSDLKGKTYCIIAKAKVKKDELLPNGERQYVDVYAYKKINSFSTTQMTIAVDNFVAEAGNSFSNTSIDDADFEIALYESDISLNESYNQASEIINILNGGKLHKAESVLGYKLAQSYSNGRFTVTGSKPEMLTIKVTFYDKNENNKIKAPKVENNYHYHAIVWDKTTLPSGKSFVECITSNDYSGISWFSCQIDDLSDKETDTLNLTNILWTDNNRTENTARYITDIPKENIQVRLLYSNAQTDKFQNLSNMSSFDGFSSLMANGIDGYTFLGQESAHPSGYKSGSGFYEINVREGSSYYDLNLVLDYGNNSHNPITKGKYYVILEATSEQNNHYYKLVPIESDGASNKVEIPVSGVWSDNQSYSINWKNVTAKVIVPKGSTTPEINKQYETHGLNSATYDACYLIEQYGYTVGEKTRNTENKDEIVITLSNKTYDNAITPGDVLGDAVEYGIVANAFNSGGSHTETNFAVNSAQVSAEIDIDGSGDNPIPFYVGALGNQLLIGDKTYVDVDVYCPANLDNVSARTDYKHRLLRIDTPSTEVSSYVTGLISAGKTTSTNLAQKVTYTPELINENNKYIDTTIFPDGKTIYINCENIRGVIGTGGWVLKKKPNQSIVFNIPGNTVKIEKFFVTLYDDNGNIISDRQNLESTTKEKNNDPSFNLIRDEVMLRHLTFNAYEAQSVELNNVSALFLAPKANNVTQTNGAGWILAEGTVSTNTEWHFYYHNRHYKSEGDTHLVGYKHIANREYREGDSFTFTISSSDEGAVYPDAVDSTNHSITITPTNGTDASIDFGTFNFKIADIGEQTKTYTYIITEENRDTAGLTYDQSEYKLVITVKKNSTDETKLDITQVLTKTKDASGTQLTTEESANSISFTNTQQVGSIAVKKSYSGIQSLPDGFKITNNFNGTEFTVSNKTSGTGTTDDPYVWTLSNIPINTEVTFTETGYDVAGKSVEVKVNGNAVAGETKMATATIGTSGNEVTFSNTYSSETGGIRITKNVTVNGSAVADNTKPSIADGEYGFTITSNGGVVTGARINGNPLSSDGKFKIKITNGQPSTVTITNLTAGSYTITEDIPTNGTALIDESGHTATNYSRTVTIEENTIATIRTAVFTNNKDVGSLVVTKQLLGIDWNKLSDSQKQAITIQVTGPYNYSRNIKLSELNDAHAITLTNLPVGEYTIAESGAADNVPDGYLFDTITISATGGKANVLKGANTSVTITNKYLSTCNASIPVKKIVTGNNYTGNDEFTFKITRGEATANGVAIADEGLPILSAESVTIKNGQTGSFGITGFKTEGTYVFKIQEESGSVPHMTYDTSERTVTITVRKDTNDSTKLVAVVKEGEKEITNSSPLIVTNEYTQREGAVEIPVKKLVSGDDYKGNEAFKFTITAGDAKDKENKNISALPTIIANEVNIHKDETGKFSIENYTVPGTYTYTIQEVAGSTPGMNYASSNKTITVVVEESGNTLLATVKDGESVIDATNPVTFTNTYSSLTTDASIPVKKTIDGPFAGTNTFTFTLTAGPAKKTDGTTDIPAADRPTISGSSITIAKDGQDSFTVIGYKVPGTYTYTIHEETSDILGMTFAADKTVTVEVGYNTGNTALIATVKEGDRIVSDTTPVVMTNRYSEVTYTPHVKKVVDGTGAPDEEFTFELSDVSTDKSGETLGAVQTKAKNGQTGEFGTITYKKEGKYTYKIKEQPGNTPGMTYSNQEITLTVEVKRGSDGKMKIDSATYTNGDGDLHDTITNQYTQPKGSATIPVKKEISGDAYDGDEEFKFTLTAAGAVDGSNQEINTLPTIAPGEISIKKDETGNFMISGYTVPGTYTYTLSEAAGETAGMQYSTEARTITIVVTANGSDLATRVTEDGREITLDKPLVVTNKYGKTTYTPYVNKIVNGENVPEEVFTFRMTDVSEDKTGETLGADTATTTGAGRATFGEITYTKAGTHEYEITEVIPENKTPGMNYMVRSQMVHLKVTVKQEESGKLTITQASYTGGDTENADSLTNNYTRPETDITLRGTKFIEGRNFQEGDSATIRIEAVTEGAPMPAESEVTIRPTGRNSFAYRFAPIHYDISDLGGETSKVFSYRVTESAFEMEDVNGDERVYEVAVTVTYDPETMEMTAVSNPDPEQLDFINTTKKGTLEIEKVFRFSERTPEPTPTPTPEPTQTPTPEVTETPEPTATPEPETVDITVTKEWVDNNNADGNRPGSITVRLMADGAQVNAATLTAAGGWSHTFTDLPRMNGESAIVYTISEDAVTWYDTEINGYHIRNTYKPMTTSVSVRKIWDDDNNAAGLRPSSIMMRLSNGMIVELNEGNNWSATISDLPMILNGVPVSYSWKEQEVLGYEETGVAIVGSTTVFTNTLRQPKKPQEGKKTGTKRGNNYLVIEDYGTPLGVEVVINHVGDCFD